MIKKGFTLIEVIVVISIMTILFGYSLLNLRSLDRIENNVDVQLFGNTLVDFIINSKKYCRDNNLNGYIYFVTSKGTAQLCCGTNVISSVKLPENFTELSVNRTGGKITIDNKGFSKDACTIKFKDRKGGIHYLTMCVGTSNVEFKN